MGDFHLEFKAYQRNFKIPLRTAHGLWTRREGVLLRLTDKAGRTGYGEVAPLEAFKTESVKDAIGCLRSLPSDMPRFGFSLVSSSYPCVQMALWAAEQQVYSDDPPERCFPVVGLLPAGENAFAYMETLVEQGYHTFKWKIGVHPIEEEIGIFNKLLEDLPVQGAMRLDANGSLGEDNMEYWLERLSEVPQLAFLEQPLPPGREEVMQSLATRYGVHVALDESVCQVDTLFQALISGWKGNLVIKPSIVGSPLLYHQWQAAWQRHLVFSSAFETAIGLEAGLRIAAALPEPEQVLALGFGTQVYFEADGMSMHPRGPEMVPGQIGREEMEAVWKNV